MGAGTAVLRHIAIPETEHSQHLAAGQVPFVRIIAVVVPAEMRHAFFLSTNTRFSLDISMREVEGLPGRRDYPLRPHDLHEAARCSGLSDDCGVVHQLAADARASHYEAGMPAPNHKALNTAMTSAIWRSKSSAVWLLLPLKKCARAPISRAFTASGSKPSHHIRYLW